MGYLISFVLLVVNSNELYDTTATVALLWQALRTVKNTDLNYLLMLFM